MSIAKRLRKALDLREMSVREFHRQMQGRGVRGSAYPTIHRYLAGKSEPSISFLKSAAELLDVREVWLAQGDGASTAQEEGILRSGEPDEDSNDADGSARFAAIYERHPYIANLRPDLQWAFIGHWGGASGRFSGGDPTIAEEWGIGLADGLVKLLEILPHEPDLDSGEFQTYFRAALLAQELALAVPPIWDDEDFSGIDDPE